MTEQRPGERARSWTRSRPTRGSTSTPLPARTPGIGIPGKNGLRLPLSWRRDWRNGGIDHDMKREEPPC